MTFKSFYLSETCLQNADSETVVLVGVDVVAAVFVAAFATVVVVVVVVISILQWVTLWEDDHSMTSMSENTWHLMPHIAAVVDEADVP